MGVKTSTYNILNTLSLLALNSLRNVRVTIICQCINEGAQIFMLMHHAEEIQGSLAKYKRESLFDSYTRLGNSEKNHNIYNMKNQYLLMILSRKEVRFDQSIKFRYFPSMLPNRSSKRNRRYDIEKR